MPYGIIITMRETIVPIDKAGRVVIPKWVREGMNIQAGDELKISIDGLQIRLESAVEDEGTVASSPSPPPRTSLQKMMRGRI